MMWVQPLKKKKKKKNKTTPTPPPPHPNPPSARGKLQMARGEAQKKKKKKKKKRPTESLYRIQDELSAVEEGPMGPLNPGQMGTTESERKKQG